MSFHGFVWSGHGGAQLAVCRDGARGAKIEVWWDGDRRYYPGIVAGWDPATTEYDGLFPPFFFFPSIAIDAIILTYCMKISMLWLARMA
jgi:hypothetical protein